LHGRARREVRFFRPPSEPLVACDSWAPRTPRSSCGCRGFPIGAYVAATTPFVSPSTGMASRGQEWKRQSTQLGLV
jgi:hypothetical protein